MVDPDFEGFLNTRGFTISDGSQSFYEIMHYDFVFSNTLHSYLTHHSLPRYQSHIQNNLKSAHERENRFRQSFRLLFLNPVTSIRDCCDTSEICATLIIRLNGAKIQIA
jgi:hypothetical protein